MDSSFLDPQTNCRYRQTKKEDFFQLAKLYYDAYQGSYPDPLMRDFHVIQKFLEEPHHFWFVAEHKDHIIASVLFRYDPDHLIAKAFGAVVSPDYRGRHLMEQLLRWSMDEIKDQTPGLDIVYSTTRTVNESAQSLTERCGFSQLGIFPNVRKTINYETHALAAIISPHALKQRMPYESIHFQLFSLYELVSQQLSLSAVARMEPTPSSKYLFSIIHLELITAKHFIDFRYQKLKSEKKLVFEFFPFYEPNVMLMSPDQKVEIFCYLSPYDGHCAYIGASLPEEIDYGDLFLKSNQILRDHSARYIEILVRADRPKILEKVLQAKFIPCAFFPAFQKLGSYRYDFFVFSKSYEIFDFQQIRLKGINQKFLEEYFKAWKKVSLTPKLLEESPHI